MLTLTGCPAAPVVTTPAAAAPAPQVQPAVVIQPAIVVQPAVIVAADFDTIGFIYYPNYEVYYDPGARVYWHAEGGRWINGPTPLGISVDVLQASPNVRMNFHDSPENHHSEVIKQYPHDWQPAHAPERGNAAALDHAQPAPPDRGRSAVTNREQSAPSERGPDRRDN